MFLVASRLDEDVGFDHLFFACPIGHASKIARRNVERLERNLSSPVKDFFSRDVF